MEIVSLSGDEIVTLMKMASRADAEDKSFYVASRGGKVCFRVGGGMWTPSFGTKE